MIFLWNPWFNIINQLVKSWNSIRERQVWISIPGARAIEIKTTMLPTACHRCDIVQLSCNAANMGLNFGLHFYTFVLLSVEKHNTSTKKYNKIQKYCHVAKLKKRMPSSTTVFLNRGIT